MRVCVCEPLTIRTRIHILIRMNATIYIRQENEDAWKAIEDKSRWVNEKLGGFYPEGIDKVRAVNIDTMEPIEEAEEDEHDFYENLILDVTGNSGVWDTSTGEQVEADPEMIKELKKRNQTR